MLAPIPGPPLLTAAAMRAAEAAAMAGGVSATTLMDRAAAAATAAIARLWTPRAVLVLCGPGNNGGDGFGIAAALRARGWPVTVAADALPTSDAGAAMLARWGDDIVPLAAAAPAPLVIDALFGTGLTRQLAEAAQAALDRVRGRGQVAAVDIASGVDADTGRALGRPLAADLTVTFAAAKPGHLLGAGGGLTGRLVVADIGVAMPADTAWLVAPPRLVVPGPDTHKYARGHVLVVEGAGHHCGATRLTALAALRAGAGLVTLAGPGLGAPADAVMRRTDKQGRALLDDRRTGAVAIGPGLPDKDRGRDWLAAVLASGLALVLDAGALALADPDQLAGPNRVLTPHDGEFSKLFGPVGEDRIAATSAAAARSGCVVLLKGSASVIAAPDGRVAINAHAAPWLATAGSGDVLAGIIAALLAQGLAAFDAASIGAWLHGDAGVRVGPGLIADDLAAVLPAVLAGL
ncbi:hypothetical protein IP88_15780 [alpha proteobacterium AAP81b]|nr:hypothetical protein IP88_15780 [alpha proteobacterium AAP81b]